MIKKIVRAIKEKRFIRAVKIFLLRKITGKSIVVTENMAALPFHIEPCRKGDFVRNTSLRLIAHEINKRNLEGDVAELGVFQGFFAKEINEAFPNRRLYLFDTFEGFDNRDRLKEEKAGYGDAAQDFSDTSIEKVLNIMPYKEKCIIKKGWFPETTDGLGENKFVFVSIDADLFDPIYAGLKFFYPHLVKGGVIFVHDYNNKAYPGAGEAVSKYCEEMDITYFCIPDTWGSAVILK